MRPRVGITCSSKIHEERHLVALEEVYAQAVSRAGGVPFVLPTLDPSDAIDVLGAVDALILAGGGDVDPLLYGATAHEEVDGVDVGRDCYEIALVGEATRRGLPVLGICRGLQVINVARGGTLVQHVPAVTGEDHRVTDRAKEPVHPVSVVTGTLLERILGADTVEVNSLHHQAVEVLGDGLAVAARAHDLTIEAVVAVDGDRVVGVQWHPELLVLTPAGSELFDWLVDEAGRPPVGDVTSIPAPDSWTLDDAVRTATAVA
jgi:putative glutamine amidotransferase